MYEKKTEYCYYLYVMLYENRAVCLCAILYASILCGSLSRLLLAEEVMEVKNRKKWCKYKSQIIFSFHVNKHYRVSLSVLCNIRINNFFINIGTLWRFDKWNTLVTIDTSFLLCHNFYV